MTLYFYYTVYGSEKINMVIAENVEITVDGNYKLPHSKEFPIINRQTMPCEYVGSLFEHHNFPNETEDFTLIYISKVQDESAATKTFCDYYSYLYSEAKAKMLTLEKTTSYFELLEKAKHIAKEAHRGQKDKAGKDYFTHPETVASLVTTIEEKIVAYLHDTIEDTPVTANFLLNAGFPNNIVDAILLLSKDSGMDYDEYLKEIKNNELARKVKLADLNHNSDLSRIPKPTSKDFARQQKYLSAITFLIS